MYHYFQKKKKTKQKIPPIASLSISRLLSIVNETKKKKKRKKNHQTQTKEILFVRIYKILRQKLPFFPLIP